MKFIKKYWKQISTILAVLAGFSGWCWRLAVRIDASVDKIQQFEQRVIFLEQKRKTVNNSLSNHDKRISKLELIESFREKK